MDLRKEFEELVNNAQKETGVHTNVANLFAKSNQHYIEWLETELKKLRLGAVIKSLDPELQKALNDFSKTQETKEPTKKRF